MAKLPLLEEHIDLETNHPNKLFRAITDLYDDLESMRGYDRPVIHEPVLEETPIGDVANVNGWIGAAKTFPSHPKGRIIGGIIIALIGAIVTFAGQMALSIFVNLNFDSSTIIFFVGIGLIIIGIIIALVKSKTELNIAVRIKGESYRYKGKKRLTGSELEDRERLDVVSDIRITLQAYPSKNCYFKPEFKEILKDDLKFLYSKLSKIVPEYRVPSSK